MVTAVSSSYVYRWCQWLFACAPAARVFSSLCIVVLSSVFLSSCENKQPVQVVSLGAPQSLLPSLIWLTDELGFFKDQGVQLNLHVYPSGKRALQALMKEEEDLAATAETPFVIACFTQDDLRLYATMGQSDNEIRVLARRDHGIKQVADLKGKIFGVQQGSAIHYFLSSFLLYYQLESTNIDIRFLKVEDLHLALAKGEVDAISIREPYLSKAKEMIGVENLVELAVPGLYTKTYNLVGNKTFTEKHPGVMQKILFALHEGERYIDSHPQEAIKIIANKLGLSSEQVASLWPLVRLSITLNQGLLGMLQEEAFWVARTKVAKQSDYNDGRVPDFLNFIDSAPLEQAVPYAVGLIGISDKQ